MLVFQRECVKETNEKLGSFAPKLKAFFCGKNNVELEGK